MATATETDKFDFDGFVDTLLTKTDDEKAVLMKGLSNTRRKKVNANIRERAEKKKGKEVEKSDEEEEEEMDWEALKGVSGGGVPVVQKPAEKVVVSETEIDDMWSTIDGKDLGDIDESALADFDYQGFDAEVILRQVLTHGKSAGLTNKQIMKDITSLAGLAQKKGSVTDKNYPKMKKSGQAEYDKLAARYHIVKGSGKGKSPEIITVSRIGPTFPGRIMRMLSAGKLSARSFIGPLKSSSLPKILQTQAFPPALPTTMESDAKDFVLGLCIAYSVDQTIAIADGKKPTVEEALKTQVGFVMLSHNSKHPTETLRKDMVSQINWPDLYDRSLVCAQTYKKFSPDFVVIARTDFLAAISKL